MDLDDTPQPPREILEYYARGQEDERLDREEGQLERCRTEELLLRFLPAPPADELDRPEYTVEKTRAVARSVA